MFEPLPAQFSFPEVEERILAFWEQHDVFGRSLEKRRGAPRFVFYEGPPTANGLPHPGHCLTRAIKDLFPRYQTMCGKLVERKAGWDTHGLPVEVEVCKELGIHTKEEIEAYGVEKFVKRCIESVFRYTREWEQMTRRLGFWVNLEEAYVTYHQSYVESVWWSLKTLFDRGLLYQGHKVVWWWAQGGCALSAGEVGEGYRTVKDPSVYIRFPLMSEPEAAARGQAEGTKASAAVDRLRHEGTKREGEASAEPPHLRLPAGSKTSLLVWTTTPWTLISNHFAAVGPDIDYALMRDKATGEYFYIASPLVGDVANKIKHDLEAVAVCKGRDLVGLCYEPPFNCYYDFVPFSETLGRAGLTWADTAPAMRKLSEVTAVLNNQRGEECIAWRVVPADFIDLETGTGIVHIAPAYGEVDFELLQTERSRFIESRIRDVIPLLNAVKPDGTFSDEAPPQYRGHWVKDCDDEIMRELKERGVLLHREMIEHEYPFCPRAEDDPLIQYARKSWFVRTSQFKDEFLKNNAAINWLPEHIQEGRFGDFLRNNVDWALSRERYWGTPLPIWVCEETGKMEAIGSYAELTDKPGASDRTPEYPDGMWAMKKAEDPTIPEHLKVHKPYIDAWTYDSPFVGEGEAPAEPRPKARMRRVPEVIDCWWDAGSMPFAQWGFPHAPDSVKTFTDRFPADFISEAIDQTRGWFYGLLSISTLLFSKRAGQEYRQREEPALRGVFDVEPEYAHLTNVVIAKHSDTGREQFDWLERSYPHPYKTCIVLGHVMGEDGLKMSKRTKNYKEPSYIFDTYGADAMRWYFFSAQVPWTTTRFAEANIRDAQREFLVRLYNVFSFFSIYANIDGFEARRVGTAHPTGHRPVRERSELDRWITSELHRTIRSVRESMDRFENYPAAGRLNDFVDALSNWYVRRSRERFWRAVAGCAPSDAGTAGILPAARGDQDGRGPVAAGFSGDQDKWDAYNTLYEVLLTLSQLIAPFTPFFAEVMYQNLVGIEGAGTKGLRAETAATPLGPSVPESLGPSTLNPSVPQSLNPCPISVHLCDYPAADETLLDEELAQEMDLVRQIVSLGRAARTAAKLKVRQPLALAEIVLARGERTAWLEAHSALIAEELNIKRVEFAAEADHYVTYQIKPEFKAIGPKFGKLAPKVAAALQQLDAAQARQALTSSGELVLSLDGEQVRLSDQEVHVRLEAKPGWSAAQGRAGVVVVKTELTPELKDEGLIRELIHHVQGIRKELNLAYEARIKLFVETSESLQVVVRRFADTIQQECLADEIVLGPVASGDMREVSVEGTPVKLALVPRS